MTEARAVSALWSAVAAAGVALTLGALAAGLTRIDFAAPGIAELAAACRRWLFPHLDVASLAVLAIAGLAAATLFSVWRSGARRLLATRRFERRLRVQRRLPNTPDVAEVDGAAPEAFCIGLVRPRIYVSSAAVATLSEAELAAVIAHERHHASRRDPLRLLVARSLGEGLFWLPVLRRLADRYAALAELAADDAARRATGGPRALASALLAFDAHPTGVVGISAQRVENLRGARVGWEFPALLLAGAAATIGGAGAATIRLVQATDHSALPLPAVIAQLCMVVMALLPVAAAATAVLAVRRAPLGAARHRG